MSNISPVEVYNSFWHEPCRRWQKPHFWLTPNNQIDWEINTIPNWIKKSIPFSQKDNKLAIRGNSPQSSNSYSMSI